MKDMYMLNNYVKEISKHQLLTAEQEIELSKLVQEKGDKEALKRLVNSNLKLVVKISIELCKGNVSLMDVIQNGNIGLMKAAEKFDYKKCVRFSTYAAFWIRQAILRGFIKPSKNVNISFRKDELNKKIKNYVKDYFLRNSAMPSVDDIVKNMSVRRKDALDVLLMIRSSGDISMNRSVYESNEEFIDSIQDERYNPEKIMENRCLMEELLEAMDSFSDRDCEIIKKRFGFERNDKETLNFIGSQYDITAEATRQIERKVLAMIKSRYPALSYYLYAQ